MTEFQIRAPDTHLNLERGVDKGVDVETWSHESCIHMKSGPPPAPAAGEAEKKVCKKNKFSLRSEK